MQTKRDSFQEAVSNTFIGFITTLIASPLFYWICGVEVHVGQVTMLTLLFTVLSIARNYIIRRWFNKKEK